MVHPFARLDLGAPGSPTPPVSVDRCQPGISRAHCLPRGSFLAGFGPLEVARPAVRKVCQQPARLPKRRDESGNPVGTRLANHGSGGSATQE